MDKNNPLKWVGIIIVIAFIIFGLYKTIGFPQDLDGYSIWGCVIIFILLVIAIFSGKKTTNNPNNILERPITINTKFKEISTVYHKDYGTDYYVITSWINPDDNKLYLFKSDDIGFDATENIKNAGIEEFPVTYEDGNIENYSMDVSKVKEVYHEKTR